MILKPFKVHSPDGKTFYEGEGTETTTTPSSAQSGELMFDHRDVSDLLDCPFCGSRPSLHPVGNNFTKSRKLTVKCTGCRMQLTNAAIRNDFSWLRKNTVEDWNRRAAASAQSEISAEFKAWFEREWTSYEDKAISGGKIVSMAWALKGYRAAASAQATAQAAQEPVATLHDDGHYTWHGAKPHDFNYAGWRMKVYAAPSPAAREAGDGVRDVERDAARYRWLHGEHFPTAEKPPLAQVVWKAFDDRHSGQWANMIDGHDLDAAIDAALSAQPAKE